MVAAGENGLCTLGDGTTDTRYVAIAIPNLSDVTHLAIAGYHVVARTGDGDVFSWGVNGSGQLGDGTTDTGCAPAQVAALSAITHVGASGSHSLAISSTGIVYSWGWNEWSQLGDGTTTSRLQPTAISGEAFLWQVAAPTFSVAAGTYHLDQAVTVSTTTAGATIHYTQNGSDPTTSDATVTSGSTVTISASQTLKARAFKTGVTSSDTTSAIYVLQVDGISFSPAPATYTSAQTVELTTQTPGATIRYTTDGSTPTTVSPAYADAIEVSASTVIKAVGFKTSWSNSALATGSFSMNFGELPSPSANKPTGSYVGAVMVTLSETVSGATIRYTTDNSPVHAQSSAYSAPMMIDATTTLRFKAFHPDYTSSPDVTRIYTITPPASPSLDTRVAGGIYHSLVVAADGAVWAAGGNTHGQIGDGTDLLRDRPVEVAGVSDVIAVTAGANHSLALTSGGAVWAWGLNSSGQLGTNSTTSSAVPVNLGLTDIVAIAAGRDHSLALQQGGNIYAWGWNGFGQLGDGTTIDRTAPVLVATGGAAIAGGGYHSLFVKTDGTVEATGFNQFGALGDSTNVARMSPVPMVGITAAAAAWAGDFSSFILLANGMVLVAGENGLCTLGDGTTDSRYVAVPLPNLTHVTQLGTRGYHVVALTGEGDVFAWGANGSGEVGDGTMETRCTPTRLTTLSGIAQVGAGRGHSLAISASEVVYAWGWNEWSQLGDGTSASRTTPTVVIEPEDPAVLTVALTSPFPGTTFNAPASVSLEAFASVTSGTLSRIDFYSGSTLVGSASAPPYQTTWTSPPEGSHLLTAQAVDSTAAVTTSASVHITIAPAGADMGTLGAPIANPPGGVYGPAQSVALTAAPGATIHYTLDGTDPDEMSAIYSAALTIAQSTTLKARAFQTAWARSDFSTDIYQMDTVPPTVVATLVPAPNAAGWNKGPVTLSFACSDNVAVATCPAPVTVTDDGVGQLITVTAVDTAGLQRNLSVTVNVDSQPPIVTLVDPTADVSTTANTLAVSASVNDAASGLVKAICNGQFADPSGGSVNCAVSLLPGRNTVIVSATDLAGNSASVGLRATRVAPPAALTMSPTTVALAVGDAKVLTVTTNLGLPATDLTWESSDPEVVAISSENDGTVTGEALGVATITATANGLTAQAEVRVLPGAVAFGEAIWSSAPSPGSFSLALLKANPVLDDDPDLFNVEFSGGPLLVKAIRAADGATLWTEQVDDRPVPDAFGGFLVKGPGGPMTVQPLLPTTALRRLGNGGVAPWEYVSEGFIDRVASSPDGTVYLTEAVLTTLNPESIAVPSGTFDVESAIVVLDGRTGAVRVRIPVPSNRRVFRDRFTSQIPDDCSGINQDLAQGASFGPITILENGDAAVQQIEERETFVTSCHGVTNGTVTKSSTVRLWRIKPQGQATSYSLNDWSQSVPASPGGAYNRTGMQRPSVGANRPDGRGGVLASWYYGVWISNSTLQEDTRLTQISSGGALTVRPGLPHDGDTVDSPERRDIMVTSPGIIYLPASLNGELMAHDTDSWSPRWPAPRPNWPIEGLTEGRLLSFKLVGETGMLLQELDSDGNVAQSYPSTIFQAVSVLPNHGFLHGLDLTTGSLTMIATPIKLSAELTFLANELKMCKVTKLNADVYPTTLHWGLLPDRGTPYLYKFEDAAPDSPAEAQWRTGTVDGVKIGDQQDGVREAFDSWSEISFLEDLGYSFKEVEPGQSPDITVKKGDMSSPEHQQPVGTAGYFRSHPLMPNRRITGGEIVLSIDERYLLTQIGYKKAVLHEVGHALGLAHPWAPSDPKPDNFPLDRGRTVMNNLGYNKPQDSSQIPIVRKRDDPAGNVALTPTECDVKGVRVAKTK